MTPRETAAGERRVVKIGGREVIVVMPALEPGPSFLKLIGGTAIFAYTRWSAWAIGFEVLAGGLAIHIGPAMLGLVRRDTYLNWSAAHLREGDRDRG